MSESFYSKLERKAGEELAALVAKPLAPSEDMIGVINEFTDEPEYFDPWDIFPLLYGSYSSSFDDMALEVLTNLVKRSFSGEELAHEMFREILCNKSLCDYGTSPRVCFPTKDFEELLPEYIEKWKQYYELQWGRPYDGADGTDLADERSGGDDDVQ